MIIQLLQKTYSWIHNVKLEFEFIRTSIIESLAEGIVERSMQD